jgi:hypothetical protein
MHIVPIHPIGETEGGSSRGAWPTKGAGLQPSIPACYRAAMLAALLALGILSNPCPMTIGITRDGALYVNRMGGWYKTSLQSLDGDLRGGCYNDANPSVVTSVKLAIAPGASQARVDRVYTILEKEGWPKAKVSTLAWKNDPQLPN